VLSVSVTATTWALLKAVSSGEFAVGGFRNRGPRTHLHRGKLTLIRRGASAKVGRRLRMLRGHGVIKKVRLQRLVELDRRQVGNNLFPTSRSCRRVGWGAVFSTSSREVHHHEVVLIPISDHPHTRGVATATGHRRQKLDAAIPVSQPLFALHRRRCGCG
jgi:hypothetical protein